VSAPGVDHSSHAEAYKARAISTVRVARTEEDPKPRAEQPFGWFRPRNLFSAVRALVDDDGDDDNDDDNDDYAAL
jgi:hypothetical protein